MFLCNSWTEKRRRRKLSKSNRLSHQNDLTKSLPNLGSSADAFQIQKITAQESNALREITVDAGIGSSISESSPISDRLEDTSRSSTDIAAYCLRVHLKNGSNLLAMDNTGSSDPYAKILYNNCLLYKTETIMQNLNPRWDEHFEQYIDDLSVPLKIEVYDFDRFTMDDYMGGAEIHLSTLQFDQLNDLQIQILHPETNEKTGTIHMSIYLKPKSQMEMIEMKDPHAISENSKKRSKSRPERTSVIHIVLVKAKQLRPITFYKSAPKPDPYVKMKLGEERVKSKAALKTLDPEWTQEFIFHPRNQLECILDLQILDKKKDQCMGKCAIDLTSLDQEITHHKWYDLDQDGGKILLVITITGLAQGNVSDLNSSDLSVSNSAALCKKFSLLNTISSESVGFLIVKLYKAVGLASLDIGGKSDPFAVVELLNSRLQTHTVYKTLNPEWNKIFTFNVDDVHSILEITIYDEDPNKKIEFMGKVAVPLLNIKNDQKRWYALKDAQLNRRVKGRILVEMCLYCNPIRAALRTLAPKEQKYVIKGHGFKRKEFLRHMARMRKYGRRAARMVQFVQSCFTWKSPVRSLMAFMAFILVTYFFQLYMAPMALVIFLLIAFVNVNLCKFGDDDDEDHDYVNSDQEEEDEEEDAPTSIGAKLEAIQNALLELQTSLDFGISTTERIRNTFNFTRPFCSYLAIFILIVAAIVLYLIPMRWLIMAWGVNKFTKKFRKPKGYVDNNELLDFLSRIPSDKELRMYGEFQLKERPQSESGYD